jgi:hypothetical protein
MNQWNILDLNLYGCIMRSFLHKKRLVFWHSDIPCRNIILSLHFFVLRFFWNNDSIPLGVSLQKKKRRFCIKKIFYQFRLAIVFIGNFLKYHRLDLPEAKAKKMRRNRRIFILLSC